MLYTMSMKKKDENIPTVFFESQQDWEAWLSEHYAEPSGVWIKMAKKETGIASVTHVQALEGALCYGWIDGQRDSFDKQYFLQKFTPRRPKSTWSKINCEKVTTLIEAGRMQAAGLRQIELAKADGRWDQAYDGQRKATVPDDLQSALNENPQAQAFFET